MEFFKDLTQAYSWASIKHPISAVDNKAKLSWKEIAACGGIATGVGVVTLPAFPFTAFAAYYLSRHYILKNKITFDTDNPSKIQSAVQNSDSPLGSKRGSAEGKMEQGPVVTVVADPAPPESLDESRDHLEMFGEGKTADPVQPESLDETEGHLEMFGEGKTADPVPPESPDETEGHLEISDEGAVEFEPKQPPATASLGESEAVSEVRQKKGKQKTRVVEQEDSESKRYDDEPLNIEHLPNEILLEVFSHLKEDERAVASAVNKRWNALIEQKRFGNPVIAENILKSTETANYQLTLRSERLDKSPSLKYSTYQIFDSQLFIFHVLKSAKEGSSVLRISVQESCD